MKKIDVLNIKSKLCGAGCENAFYAGYSDKNETLAVEIYRAYDEPVNEEKVKDAFRKFKEDFRNANITGEFDIKLTKRRYKTGVVICYATIK